MATPNYLDPEALANALKGFARVLEMDAEAIYKGKNLRPEDADALRSFAVAISSAAKTLSDMNKKLNQLKEIINK